MYDGILTNLKDQYTERYGLAVFDLQARRDGEAVRLSGRVLLEAQKRAAEEELHRATGLEVESQVLVLADPKSGAEQGWGLAAKEIVDVWRVPPPLVKSDKDRSTQIIPQDRAFRLLLCQGEWRLIQLDDLTLGWTRADDIRCLALWKRQAPVGSTLWADVRRALKDELVEVNAAWEEALTQVARSYEGAPYLWGGTTEQGLDCSGLVQRAYRKACHLVLPRHSGDQRKVGVRVPFERLTRGDVLVLRPKGRKGLHVGLCLGGQQVIHACCLERGVVVEERAHLLKRYNLIGVRRIVAAT